MFDRSINIEKSSSKYQKDILTADENYQGTQHIKRIFWYLHVAVLIKFLKYWSPNALNSVQNGNFSIFSLL